MGQRGRATLEKLCTGQSRPWADSCALLHPSLPVGLACAQPLLLDILPRSWPTAVILGGGAGTRLYPLTKNRAKPAVPIGGAYRLVSAGGCCPHVQEAWASIIGGTGSRVAWRRQPRRAGLSLRSPPWQFGFGFVPAMGCRLPASGSRMGRLPAVKDAATNCCCLLACPLLSPRLMCP